MMARWMTRWNPSVGCVSTSSVPATCGVLSLMKFARRAQVFHIGRTGAQHFGCAGVVEQSEQQMLHGDELVALLAGLHEGHMQATSSSWAII